MDLQKILQSAREISDRKGTITSDQLSKLCPKELGPDDVHALLKALRDEGIQLADDKT
ncbi:RNA polymerase subunit sigma-70 [Bradyrhizobium macuxiense]|uniref:RNA polymerase subunit sigma-70 n=1 Tax=Bradyrhizobium macuxiense TaxID=1755647 RepID=UPI000AE84D7C|nr:RNA polymerase subunit sigma-70 [Bradyrhizobium macuxiense]